MTYCYIYTPVFLFHEKSQPLDMFKAVKSDHGGSTMTDMTNQVNVQNHLSISERVVLSLSTPYQGHLVKMVLLKDKITH